MRIYFLTLVLVAAGIFVVGSVSTFAASGVRPETRKAPAVPLLAPAGDQFLNFLHLFLYQSYKISKNYFNDWLTQPGYWEFLL